VRGDLFRAGALAEAGNIRTSTCALIAAPGVVDPGDSCDLLLAELTVSAVHQVPKLTGVDEERLPAAVAESAVLLAARQEPRARGDLSGLFPLPATLHLPSKHGKTKHIFVEKTSIVCYQFCRLII